MSKLLVCAGIARFTLTSATRHADDCRNYVAKDVRAIAVYRNGISLGQELAGRVVNASIGWDADPRGFVFARNEGWRHNNWKSSWFT